MIETLQTRLKAYVAENNREWSNVNVNIEKMEYQNALTLIIAMERTCIIYRPFFFIVEANYDD